MLGLVDDHAVKIAAIAVGGLMDWEESSTTASSPEGLDRSSVTWSFSLYIDHRFSL